MPLTKDDYIFFWKTDEVHGWGSQWIHSPFTVPINLDPSNPNSTAEPITFPTAEHWMMFQKALLFNDVAVAREVLSITKINSPAMAEVKALGRKVQNFDEAKWVAHRDRIVLEGNLHKFRQNEEMMKKLLDTGNKRLVEASPRDRIWGVGYGEKNALSQKDSWGLNLLGKALEETRRILREELESQAQAHEADNE
ncbi:hypothetical protein CVT24_003197 [Panaeolus cyanescens]|uniref:NADAR domain-containing protein n=1 Tax=Panaeolus cyanescens TaxID=181874 RepID=A0A409W8J5_9AGAR|nr:hypothetical protein CVT24_003197 [Panaeolus cyanescens]